MDIPQLSADLRAGTKTAHRAVESTPFARLLFSGQAQRATYVEYLRALHPIYAALEAALERLGDHSVVRAVRDPALSRTAALEADLRWFTGAEDWRETLPRPEAVAYARRIEQAADADPALLISHHYTRYLGDLSGGQMLKRIVVRTFDLKAETGAAFYAFPAILDPEAYKVAYRARLDGLALSASVVSAVVAEACLAFDLNHRLFEALAPTPSPAG